MIKKFKETNEVQDDRLVKKITLAEYPQLAHAHKLIKVLGADPNRVDAFVVGGAPRDILTGKEIKDVDVFLCVYSEPGIASAMIRIVQTCMELGLVPEVSDTDAYGDIRVTAGNLYLVIQGDYSAENIVNSFDMVSSQAWLEIEDDGFRVCSSDLFKKLDTLKILGYYPENVKESYDHIERVCNKYPDYFPLALSVKTIESMFDDDFDGIPF